MPNSNFWRVMAVAGCGAVFYAGHNLRGDTGKSASTLISAAQASGVSVVARTDGVSSMYTSSPDGKVLYSWRDKGDGVPLLMGVATTESYEDAQRKQKAESRQREMQREAERVLTPSARARLQSGKPHEPLNGND